MVSLALSLSRSPGENSILFDRRIKIPSEFSPPTPVNFRDSPQRRRAPACSH
jgi:hypothetical protein